MPFVAHATVDNVAANINAASALVTDDLNTLATNVIAVLDELVKGLRVVYKCHPNEFGDSSPAGLAAPPGLAVAEAALVAARAAID